MKATDKAYIAGLVDGEGCITIYKRKNGHFPKAGKPWYYQPVVTIGNTDKRMLDFVVDRCKGWITKPKPQRSHWKQSYCWFISGEAMRSFLRDIIPYLVIKRKQVEIILSFPNYIDRGWGGKTSVGRSQQELEKQTNLWTEMRRLNSQGRPGAWPKMRMEIYKKGHTHYIRNFAVSGAHNEYLLWMSIYYPR